MSFNWDAVDQREKQKKLADQEHLQILREQHEEYKIRKKNEKAKEVDMVQQMLGLIPTREEEGSANNKRKTWAPSLIPSKDIKPPPFATNFGDDTNNSHSKKQIPPSITNIANIIPSPKNDPTNSSRKEISLRQHGMVTSSSALSDTGHHLDLDLKISPASNFSGYNTNDFLIRLQLAEDQILIERRQRLLLENEVSIGKQNILQLSAKFETLQNSFFQEIQLRKNETSSDAIEMTISKAHSQRKNTQLNDHFAELDSRQRYLEQSRKNDENELIRLTSEISQINTRLESLSTDVLNQKAQSILNNSRIQNLRPFTNEILEKFTHTINTIHDLNKKECLENTNRAIQKMDGITMDMRKFMERESRARTMLEQRIEDLRQEMHTLLTTSPKTLTDRFDDIQNQINSLSNRESENHHQIVESCQASYKKVSTDFGEIAKILSERLDANELSDEEEKLTRQRFERQVSIHMKELQDAIQANLDTIVTQLSHGLQKSQEGIFRVEKKVKVEVNSMKEIFNVEEKAKDKLKQDLEEIRLLVSQIKNGAEVKLESFQHELKSELLDVFKEVSFLKNSAHLKPGEENLSHHQVKIFEKIQSQEKTLEQMMKDSSEDHEKIQLLRDSYKTIIDKTSIIENEIKEIKTSQTAQVVDQCEFLKEQGQILQGRVSELSAKMIKPFESVTRMEGQISKFEKLAAEIRGEITKMHQSQTQMETLLNSKANDKDLIVLKAELTSLTNRATSRLDLMDLRLVQFNDARFENESLIQEGLNQIRKLKESVYTQMEELKKSLQSVQRRDRNTDFIGYKEEVKAMNNQSSLPSKETTSSKPPKGEESTTVNIPTQPSESKKSTAEHDNQSKINEKLSSSSNSHPIDISTPKFEADLAPSTRKAISEKRRNSLRSMNDIALNFPKENKVESKEISRISSGTDNVVSPNQPQPANILDDNSTGHDNPHILQIPKNKKGSIKFLRISSKKQPKSPIKSQTIDSATTIASNASVKKVDTEQGNMSRIPKPLEIKDVKELNPELERLADDAMKKSNSISSSNKKPKGKLYG